MKKKLGSPFGIDLFVHWSFALLLCVTGLDPVLIAFYLAVFACVTLHEYGHALAARKYGIGTDSITLYPIGGIARLADIPREPKQEMVIALAGPAVNVAIAVMLFPLAAIFGNTLPVLADTGFFPALLIANVGLVLFNMIPAFPMDGGRVLRAFLAGKPNFSYARATNIAARAGQIIAVLFALAWITGKTGPFMIVIAAMIFLAATAERRFALVREKFTGGAPGGFRTADGWEVLPPEHSSR